jgi:hypothetical protein
VRCNGLGAPPARHLTRKNTPVLLSPLVSSFSDEMALIGLHLLIVLKH